VIALVLTHYMTLYTENLMRVDSKIIDNSGLLSSRRHPLTILQAKFEKFVKG
jgi:hypothetical protein